MEKKEKLIKTEDIVVIGSGGFVGSGLNVRKEKKSKSYIFPNRFELDITNPNEVYKYFKNRQGSVCINLAAFTNLAFAEKEKGDKKGITWKVNVDGVSNLAKTAKENEIFLIHISTDAVYPGTEYFPGPYKEVDKPTDSTENLSWYGFTKLQGEKRVLEENDNSAIIRIAYPFGNAIKKRDYISRTVHYIKSGIPLFTDQQFTPTYLNDLKNALEVVSQNKMKGVYHVAVNNPITPHEFGVLLAMKLDLPTPKRGSVNDYLNSPNSVPRPKLGGLDVKFTEERLGLKFHNIKDSLNDFYESQG